MKDHIPSPCIRVCVLIADTCVGCRRTVKEISEWSEMNDTEKSQVVERVNYGCPGSENKT